MIIKLTAINDTKLGTKPAKEVVGDKIQDGTSWKKAFFANQKNLRDALEDFEVGDIVNVVMEQKGDYWNITDFREASDDDIAKATAGAKKFAGGGAKDTGFRRPDGGSRGDDTNRSAAIYLAREIVNMTLPTVRDRGYSDDAIAVRVCQIADRLIFPYIKDGKVPEEIPFDMPKKHKRGSADPLAPPEVD